MRLTGPGVGSHRLEHAASSRQASPDGVVPFPFVEILTDSPILQLAVVESEFVAFNVE